MSVQAKKSLPIAISLAAIFLFAFSATASSEKPIAPAFDALYKCLDSTYKSQVHPGLSSTGRDVMICIMPDKFAPVFQSYAEWKHKSGTFIKIVKFSDIGASSKAASCSTAIKPYIQNAYDKWTYKPAYVLLVGDAGVFPVKMFYSATEDNDLSNNSTDAYFGEVNNANGCEPDIMVGRLCVKDTAQMASMLKKIMNYERTPVMTNTAWFKKGVALSDDEIYDTVNTLQAETVRQSSKIQMAAGFIVDTLMCSDAFSGSLSTVIASINKGCSFINYRGQGWSDGWRPGCYSFTVDALPDVQNGGMLPFITGIGCGIAMFNVSPGGMKSTVSECFAEEWLRLGTANSPRGAIAVIGPTGNTHSFWNNEIDKGIYVGMFQKGLATPGQALLAGIDAMYKKTSLSKDKTDYLARLFLVLGDPSTHIWKDVPQTATITYPPAIPVGTSSQTIIVKVGSQPVPGAQVCISGAILDTITYASGFTDANGSITLSMNVTAANAALSLVARGGNILPVEKQIPVTPSGAIRNPEDHSSSFSLTVTQPQQIPPASIMTISFSLPKTGQTKVAIYSLEGALVKTLACGRQSAGVHSTTWNGRNENGTVVARGVYLVSFRQANSSLSQRITKTD